MTPISEDEMTTISEAYRMNEIVEPWAHGDVLLFDNHLTVTGRAGLTDTPDE
jgi:hypothetical protein